MKSLKEKFGKFEMTKEEVKKVKGGDWDDPEFVINDDGDNSGGGSNYHCSRTSPSGMWQNAHFGNLAAGMAWTTEYASIGWVARGCRRI